MPLFGPPNIDRLKGKLDVNGLVKALGYKKEATIRKDAVNALGEIGNPSAVPALIASLKNEAEVEEVRMAAATALGAIGDQRAIGPLMEIIRNEADTGAVRRTAATVLGEIGDEQVIEALMDTLQKEGKGRESDLRLPRLLVKVITKKSGDQALQKMTQLLVRIDDVKVQKIVVGQIDSIGWDKYVEQGEPAIQPLIHAQQSLRGSYNLVSILENFGEIAVEPLIQHLKNPEMARVSAEVLGNIGDHRCVEPLCESLTNDPKGNYPAAKALGQLGDPRAVPALITALLHESKITRYTAATALGEIGDERAVEPLIRTLKEDREEMVRVDSARALGVIGDARALEPLVAALDDRSNRVFRSAAEALGILGDVRAVEPLMSFMTNKGDVNRYQGAYALADIAVKTNDLDLTRKIAEFLVQTLQDYELNVRSASAENLGRVGLVVADDQLINRIIEALEKATHDKEKSVCESATEALEQFEVEVDKPELLRSHLLSNNYYNRKSARKEAREMGDLSKYPSLESAYQANLKLDEATKLEESAARDDAAMKLCQEALQLEPSFTPACVYLSYLYRWHRKEFALALEWARKAIGIDPKNEYAWIELGLVQVELEDGAAAARAFAKAVNINPDLDNPEPYLRLLDVYDCLEMGKEYLSARERVELAGVGLSNAEAQRWSLIIQGADKGELRAALAN